MPDPCPRVLRHPCGSLGVVIERAGRAEAASAYRHEAPRELWQVCVAVPAAHHREGDIVIWEKP